LQLALDRLPFQVKDHATACLEPSLRLIVLIAAGQSLVLHIRPFPEEILSSKFFLVTRAVQVRPEPLIKDSWNVVRCFGARRTLPVKVGRRSRAEQVAGLVRAGFFFAVFFVGEAVGRGLAVAALMEETSITDGAGVCRAFGEVVRGTGYPEAGVEELA
jgi:hypothetical protein